MKCWWYRNQWLNTYHVTIKSRPSSKWCTDTDLLHFICVIIQNSLSTLWLWTTKTTHKIIMAQRIRYTWNILCKRFPLGLFVLVKSAIGIEIELRKCVQCGNVTHTKKTIPVLDVMLHSSRESEKKVIQPLFECCLLLFCS